MSELVKGYVKPGFEPVRDAFLANFEEMEELGAGFAAIRDDEILVNIHGGWMDRRKTREWSEDTMVPVYSTTKPISALVVAHVLSAGGDADYDTPVIEFWQEFGAEGKDRLTIGDVLSHQGGLCGFKDEMDPALWLEPRELAALLAKTAPLWSPVPDGSSGYHPLTWGYLAGEIVERLAGKSLGCVLSDAFTGTGSGSPDVDFWIGTPDSEHERCADIQRPRQLPDLGPINEYRKAAFMTKWSAPDRGGAEWKRVEIPSANGHGTALGTAQIYGMFAQRGKLGDTQLIESDKIWDGLTKKRTSGPDRVLPFDMEFAAGVMHNNNRFYGPGANSLGHSGWGGSAAFGDPETGVSCAYVMNRQTNSLQGDPRAQRLFKALYGCI